MLYLNGIELCSIVTDPVVDLLGGILTISIVELGARIEGCDLGEAAIIVMVEVLPRLDRLTGHVLKVHALQMSLMRLRRRQMVL